MLENLKKSEEKWCDYEGTFELPLLGGEMFVQVLKDVELEYAEKCASYLQNLPEHVLNDLCSFAISYCEDNRKHFLDEGIEIPEEINGLEILSYIHLGDMMISQPKNDKIIAFSMTLNCDWEDEHGMEVIVRNDEILYVGGFNGGYDIWGDKDHFDTEWNFAELRD